MTAPAPADTGVMEDLRRRLGNLRDLRGPAVADFPGAVRDVVVIVSSSRGGSSMFAEILRRSDALLHLTAEINPFLRLAGLDHPGAGTGSDALGAEQLAALPPNGWRCWARNWPGTSAGPPTGSRTTGTRWTRPGGWPCNGRTCRWTRSRSRRRRARSWNGSAAIRAGPSRRCASRRSSCGG